MTLTQARSKAGDFSYLKGEIRSYNGSTYQIIDVVQLLVEGYTNEFDVYLIFREKNSKQTERLELDVFLARYKK